MKYLAGLVVSTAILLNSGMASAAHLAIDESTVLGGDFGNTIDNVTILASGVDRVTGNVGDPLIADKFDYFAFTGLATGIQTFQYSLTSTFFNEEPPIFNLEIMENAVLPIKNIITGQAFSGTLTTSASFNGTLTTIFSTNNTDIGSYSLEFKPSPVPVPAAVWLFMSGLGALGATRIRRQKKMS